MKLLLSYLLVVFPLFINLNRACAAAETAETKTATLLTDFSYTYKKAPKTVPVKIYYPKKVSAKNAPIIIMSHGLGGSREISAYLGGTWAQNDFAVVTMQHEGSNINAIVLSSRKKFTIALKKAISAESYFKRLEDVAATIDEVTKWNRDKAHPLYGMINMK